MSESNNQLFGKKIGNYTLHEFLGGGQFGQVYRAVDQEGGIVAIKIIPLESLKQHDGLVKKLLIEEVDSMAKIDNPNVVKILTYIETKKNCYLVMEYCDCGNLMDLLHKNNGQFSQVEALSIFKQISNGMMGLHEKHIMHRDLKLENIFLHQGNQVKIGDLGFSKRLKHQDDMDNVCLGTLGFMAPEVAKLEPYGLQADIFSMGAILYILLYKRLPFSSYNMPEFVRDVKRNQIDFHGNPSVTIDVINLLKAMLKEHPQDRITFYEMYKLPLFINKSQYINGITRTNIITNQINFQANKEFYEKSKFLDPEETKKQNMQQNQQLKKTILSDSGVQGEKMDLSNGIGIIDQSLDQKQQKQQKQQEEQQKQQQQQYQQQTKQTKYTKLSQNQKPDTQTYKTPEDFNNALQRYSTQQKNLLPQEEEEDQVENKQLENQPKKDNQKINLMSIQDERLINELIEKYFDRFNSIQYLLNTLYELSLIHLPSVYPIIYPQMMLHKKTIVEFKKFQKQLQANENIFQSTVHEKIKNKIDLNTLKDNINEQIVTQQNLFHIHYQAQVEHNYKKIEPYVQQKWLIDNQIEPSIDFNQNYQEAMEQIQTIVNQMKQQKIFPLLIKFERHLKCCLNFQQLLKEKVQLSMEFDLQ